MPVEPGLYPSRLMFSIDSVSLFASCGTEASEGKLKRQDLCLSTGREDHSTAAQEATPTKTQKERGAGLPASTLLVT